MNEEKVLDKNGLPPMNLRNLNHCPPLDLLFTTWRIYKPTSVLPGIVDDGSSEGGGRLGTSTVSVLEPCTI